jgi:protease IV
MSTTPQPEGQPQAPVVPEIVRPAPQYAPPPRRSPWRRVFLVLVVLALVGSFFFNLLLMGILAALTGGTGSDRKVQEKLVSGEWTAPSKVAIISVEGMILESDDGFVKRQIDQAKKDKSVKAVVLRVDSPGGSVSGSEYIYHHLLELKKERDDLPMVVSMGGVAASGGYYVSMATGQKPDVIYAEPTTWTGSIGVIIPHYNFAGFMKKHEILDDSIMSDPLKATGSLTRPMTDKQREILQGLVDDSFNHFKDIVKSGRSKFEKDPNALDKLATGQVHTADQALKNGLIDHIGFIEAAVDRAIELAGLDKEEVKVVKYKQELGLASVLWGAQSRQKPTLDLQTLLEMTTPRAYYLCTWLPGFGSAVEGK